MFKNYPSHKSKGSILKLGIFCVFLWKSMKRTLFFVCCLALAGCNKFPNRVCCTVPFFDEELYFVVKHNGVALDFNTLDSSTLYYIEKGWRYVDDPNKIDMASTTFWEQTKLMEHYPGNDDLAIMRSSWVTGISSKYGIDTFYIKYPDESIDTIFLKAEKITQEQGREELCHCVSPIREIRFNGKIATIDSARSKAYDRKIYEFDR